MDLTNVANRKNKYEMFYNVSLSEFYHFVIDVMADFSYSMYRAVREIEGRRRIEIWVHSSDDTEKGLVWIEVLKPGETLDPYLTTDVLRAMNDEEVTRLFFFTNGELNEDDREVLEGNNHFIFATEEIVETLTDIENKKSVKYVKKRKYVKTPSGVVLIKNFFKNHEIKKKQIRLKLSATPDLIKQYSKLIRKILDEIDSVDDINNIPSELKTKLKKIQYDLLPELARAPCFIFPKYFLNVSNILFNLVQVTVIYVGNFVDYEPEEELKKNRDIIEDLMRVLDEKYNYVYTYKTDMMHQAEKNAVKIILSSGVIMFIGMLLLIVVRFGK